MENNKCNEYCKRFHMQVVDCKRFHIAQTTIQPGRILGGGGNQAYSRLSTAHGHITDCKLDLVVYAGVCVCVNVDLSCLGPNDLRSTIFGFQATDPIPPQVSRKESLRPIILAPSRPVSCLTH